MSESVKLIYSQWENRVPPSYLNTVHFEWLLSEIQKQFNKAETALDKCMSINRIGYSDKLTKCNSAAWNLALFYRYLDISWEFYTLDEKLYKGFVNGATETLSNVKLEDCKVDNDLGVKERYRVPMRSHREVYETRLKSKLTFDDFLDVSGSFDGVGIQGFRDLYSGDYSKYGTQFGEEISYYDYCQEILKGGEFDHKMDKPFLQFISGLLDILTLGIKPIIEACVGKDFITGEQLSNTERALKAVFGVIDLAMVIITVVTVGTAAGPMAALRAVLLKMGAVSLGYTVTEISNELGLPPAVGMILGLATSLTVMKIGSAWVFKDINGNLIGQIAEDGTVSKNVDSDLKSFIDGMSPEDAARYDAWVNQSIATKDLSNLDYYKFIEENYYDTIWNPKNTQNFANGALEHILEGDLSPKGKAGGYHYDGIPNSAGSIIPGTETPPNACGVYMAQVEVNGIPKTAFNGYSTFFPDSWTPQQIADAINEAYNARVFVMGNTYTSILSNGMEIRMFLDKFGKIVSAFPVY